MRDRFGTFHPAVNFLYFTLTIGFAMAVQHPVAQGISLGCAVCYALLCGGASPVLRTVKFCLPMAALAAILNPLLNHQGQSVLFLLPTGSPLTKESLLYGLSAGAMLAAVLMWFLSFNRIITSDKFLFLFGKAIPGLSLILSMTLRFVPRFAGQFRAVADAQRGLGRDISKGSLLQRGKNAATILSVTVTWALENAVETADSMKSRGYGLPGRSRYSIYPFTRRDALCTAWLVLAGGLVIAGAVAGEFYFQYFPVLWWNDITLRTVLCYLVYLALCATPIIIQLWEEKKWNSIHSKI